MTRSRKLPRPLPFPEVSAVILALACAAFVGEPSLCAAASSPAASESTRTETAQRKINLAQANGPSPGRAANVPAVGQQELANLGQLLDAGGKIMTPQQFREEVAQRLVVGKLPSGIAIEVIHSSSGVLAGSFLSSDRDIHGGRGSKFGKPQNWPVSGTWNVDESERICQSIQINDAQGASVIPTRCQFWFKLDGTYYVCDSDEDRSAKLLVRALKQ